jgi:hypothetical protein
VSTSLLYHACGVGGYRYVKIEFVMGEVAFTIEKPPESYRPPSLWVGLAYADRIG